MVGRVRWTKGGGVGEAWWGGWSGGGRVVGWGKGGVVGEGCRVVGGAEGLDEQVCSPSRRSTAGARRDPLLSACSAARMASLLLAGLSVALPQGRLAHRFL